MSTNGNGKKKLRGTRPDIPEQLTMALLRVCYENLPDDVDAALVLFYENEQGVPVIRPVCTSDVMPHLARLLAMAADFIDQGHNEHIHTKKDGTSDRTA